MTAPPAHRAQIDARLARRRVGYGVAVAFLAGVVAGAGVLGFLLRDDLDAIRRRSKRLPATEALALIRKARSDSVVVYADSEHGNQRGSGFVLRRWGDDAIVATNAHVILDDAEHLLSRFRVRGSHGPPQPAYPLTWDHEFPQRDVAMLVVHDAGHHVGDAARIGVPPRPGDYVVCVGSPRGEELLPTEGHVVALVPDAELIEHDCLTDKGSSGGPVLDASGAVVGIHTYGLPDDTHYAIDLSRYVAEITLGHATVRADDGWQAVGLDAPAGASLIVVAVGTWTPAPGVPPVSANGSDDAALGPRGVVPERPFGALVCQIGEAGPAFALSNRNGVAGAAPFGGIPSIAQAGPLRCRANVADAKAASGELSVFAIAQTKKAEGDR